MILGYLEDGDDLVVVAMNGWDEGQPAWWLNLQAHPDAVVRLADGEERLVRAREAVGEERDRLWQRWVDVEPDEAHFAAKRTTATPWWCSSPGRARPPLSGPGGLAGLGSNGAAGSAAALVTEPMARRGCRVGSSRRRSGLARGRCGVVCHSPCPVIVLWRQ